MDILTVKQIRIEDYLHTLGHAPVRRQGVNLWYRSPLREEKVASFKVNTGLNCWYDFGLGKGGNVSAHFPHPACLFAGMGHRWGNRPEGMPGNLCEHSFSLVV